MKTGFGTTTQQRRALDVIRSSFARHSRPPSVRELATTLGLKSTGSACRLLDALEERGLIHRLKHKAYGIALVGDSAAPTLLSPDLQARLEAHCRDTGDSPATVIADAVALHLDEMAEKVAA